MKVNEIFLSIQGEGVSTGFPTIFIRFTGCNLRCSFCDTKYSYEDGEEMSVEEIYNEVKKFKYKRVCITGGEPLLQEDLSKLLYLLKEYEVNIETNGSVDLGKYRLLPNHRFTMDMKVPSSMESKKMIFTNFKYLKDRDEIKFVIGTREDYEWAKEVIKKYYRKGIITFSPVFNKIEPKEIVNWILQDNLDVRFQLQIHKIIWEPDEKGV
ncbi:7-carboxy-7-deazaguanine synthase [Caminicella sporogenes DSM 14501]|uniref:7-carboxy-7-deazaguanine synthase n=1 Tax=Caminicella sporogenes DSM 14501 TaxID=1121266 RepID=A0A1M6R8I8_9FIRM|nr:radical SAM protein [Caminicella sporogenes]RKD27340.1 radical SAM protein [Caminicella sporogenes]SHK28746.1 7-carboxy-7-deazaguanine synthase [Caminicella sporogenes DSM 14501]